jgi:hypothetical protein
LQHVEEGTVAVPAPVEEDVTADDSDFELGLDDLEIGGRGLSADGAVEAGRQEYGLIFMRLGKVGGICKLTSRWLVIDSIAGL